METHAGGRTGRGAAETGALGVRLTEAGLGGERLLGVFESSQAVAAARVPGG